MVDALSRLREWYASTGLSQADLSERLGCSPMSVSRLLRGKVRPGLELALAIQRATMGWEGGPIRAGEWVAEDEPEPATGTEG